MRSAWACVMNPASTKRRASRRSALSPRRAWITLARLSPHSPISTILHPAPDVNVNDPDTLQHAKHRNLHRFADTVYTRQGCTLQGGVGFRMRLYG